jgi:hypothetical protein
MGSNGDYEMLRRRIRSRDASPDAHREQMWQAISRSWSEQAARRNRARAVRPWGAAGLALAAALVAGILIGRLSGITEHIAEPNDATALVARNMPIGSRLSLPYRLALGEHFQDAETLLLLVGSADGADIELSRVARDLAATTRLLTHSRVGEDAKVRAMLLDLELLLAQVSRLMDTRDATERRIVHEAVGQSTLLPRLRQWMPDQLSATGI